MIYIDNIIGNDKAQGQIGLIDVVSAVQNDKEPILKVVISSPGGNSDIGFAIYNFLKKYTERPVYTIARGQCDSVASVIFCAGVKRFIGCDMTIHNPAMRANEDTRFEQSELEYMAEVLEKTKRDAAIIYKEVTGIDDTTLSTLMDSETIITPEQALQLGFATDLDRVAPVLFYDTKKIINQNEQEMETKLDKFIEKVEMLLKKKIKVEMMTILASDGTEIELDKETGEPQVGDLATPVGTFLMPNGSTIVIEEVDGVSQITNIIPAEQPAPEESEQVKLLKLQNEQLKAENAALKAEGKQQDMLLTQSTEMLKDYKRLKDKETTVSFWTPEMREQKRRSDYTDASDYIKGQREKLNKKGE